MLSVKAHLLPAALSNLLVVMSKLHVLQSSAWCFLQSGLVHAVSLYLILDRTHMHARK